MDAKEQPTESVRGLLPQVHPWLIWNNTLAKYLGESGMQGPD